MEKKYTVYELTEDELNDIVGGDDLPRIVNYICGRCNNRATKCGFIMRSPQGAIMQVHFDKPLCDFCAQQEVDVYKGWEFIKWML